MQFGRKSEKLDPGQFALALEDVEQAVAASEAADDKQNKAAAAARAEKRRANRGALPAHLPRVHVTIKPENRNCPCCRSPMHAIGADVSERLDVIPAQFRVLVTHRPKYACRACEQAVVQAPAPERLIKGGLPTEAMVASVLVVQIRLASAALPAGPDAGRQGLDIKRSTLAFWVGDAAAELRPVYERLRELILTSGKIAVDETKAPVLDPGRGKTKTGQLWAYARDDRPWGGPDPPAVAYRLRSPTASTSVPPRIWPASLDASRSMATAPTKRWPRATRLRWLSAGRTRGETSSTSRPRTRPRSPSRRWRGSAASTPSNAISGGSELRRGWPPAKPAPDRSSRR